MQKGAACESTSVPRGAGGTTDASLACLHLRPMTLMRCHSLDHAVPPYHAAPCCAVPCQVSTDRAYLSKVTSTKERARYEAGGDELAGAPMLQPDRGAW